MCKQTGNILFTRASLSFPPQYSSCGSAADSRTRPAPPSITHTRGPAPLRSRAVAASPPRLPLPLSVRPPILELEHTLVARMQVDFRPADVLADVLPRDPHVAVVLPAEGRRVAAALAPRPRVANDAEPDILAELHDHRLPEHGATAQIKPRAAHSGPGVPPGVVVLGGALTSPPYSRSDRS